MTHIVYIHGANATPKSFSYLERTLPEHTSSYVVYDASTKLTDTIQAAAEKIDQPCHIISHSLGGIIGVAVAQYLGGDNIHTITTISTPFGGSETADRMRLVMPFNTFFKNIRTTNPVLKAVRTLGPPVPTLNIITTGGQSPFEPKPNDGVVTVESQLAFNGTHRVQLPYTHFEVLMDNEVSSTIALFMSSYDSTAIYTKMRA